MPSLITMANFIMFLCNRVINNDPNSDNAYFKIREVKSRLKTNNGKSPAKELNKLIENAPSNVGITGRGKRFYGDVSQRNKRSKSARPNFCLNRWWQSTKNAKPKSNYSSTKVKARNFLSNIAWRKYCRRLKKNDHKNESFIIDVSSFITLNLNSVSIERKFDNPTDKNNVNNVTILWEICMPVELFRFINLEEKF